MTSPTSPYSPLDRRTEDPAPEVPGIAIFDLDGTLTRRDTFLAYLTGFLRRTPVRWPRTLPLPGAVSLYYGGQRDNTWLKIVFLRAILGGLAREDLASWTERFLDRLVARGLRSEARHTMDRHRAVGDRLVLATASLDLYVEPFGARLGFDAVLCTRVAWDPQGRLTGALSGPNCYGAAKLARVESWTATSGLTGPLSVYADHHSDLELLQRAERPVAVCPTPRLRAAARRLSIPVQEWS